MATLITNPTNAPVALPAGFFGKTIDAHEGIVVSDGKAAVDLQISGLGLDTFTIPEIGLAIDEDGNLLPDSDGDQDSGNRRV